MTIETICNLLLDALTEAASMRARSLTTKVSSVDSKHFAMKRG